MWNESSLFTIMLICHFILELPVIKIFNDFLASKTDQDKQKIRIHSSQVLEELCKLKREGTKEEKELCPRFLHPNARSHSHISTRLRGFCSQIQSKITSESRGLGRRGCWATTPPIVPSTTPALSFTLDMVCWLQTSVSSFGSAGLWIL